MIRGFDTPRTAGLSGRGLRGLRNGATVALGVFALSLYLIVFRPMTGEVAELETNLQRTQRQIEATGFGYPEHPGAYLEDARTKLETMRTLAEKLAGQTAFYPGIEEFLASPFRVLEFEQRRFDIRRSLTRMAEERGSSLPTDLFAGLPSYATTTERQPLLWFHLEFFNHVMQALLASGTDLEVERVETLPVRRLGERSKIGNRLLELQLRLKVRGSAPSLAAFLNASLPGQIKDPGSPIQGKAYLMDRLDLRSADGDGKVILDTLLRGFILANPVF